MYRIRLSLPKRQENRYKNLDILHDAVVNGFINAGAESAMVIGPNAVIWNFAALGWRKNNENRAHTLVISTPDPILSEILENINPADVSYARAITSETVNFSLAEIIEDPAPVAPGQSAIGVVMLSPLAISRQDKAKASQRWHTNLNHVNISSSVNFRLTRLTGKSVNLSVDPDRLYLRAHPRHDTLVKTKEMKNGSRAFVIGMRAPLVLQGSEDDLKLAWYAGIGEKNRNGFGCIGLAERGIGR